MAKRTAVQRFESTKVQGQGSYVEFSAFSWGEIKELRKHLIEIRRKQDREGEELKKKLDAVSDQASAEAQALREQIDDHNQQDLLTPEMERMICERIRGWNWVDDDGNAIPVPRATKDLDSLKVGELSFLSDSMSRLTFEHTEAQEKSKN